MESYYDNYKQVVENLDHKIELKPYATSYVNKKAQRFFKKHRGAVEQHDMVKNGETFDLFQEIHLNLSTIFSEQQVSLIQMFMINDELNELKQKINVPHKQAIPYV
jgi:hypothetical protein